MILFVVIFFFSFLISIILTNGIKQLSLSYGFHDVPDNDRKVHTIDIPTLGGIAIFLSLWGTIVLLDAMGISYFEKIIFRIFFVSLFFVFVGIFDDVKGVSAKLKLFVQLFSGFLFFLWNKNDMAIIYGNIILTNTILTIVSGLFFAMIINGINFIDGLDGLCTGISIILSIPLLIFSLVIGKNYVFFIILSLMGALFGFLIFNFYPAKIFMGDTGSLFLGSLFAMLIMILMYHIPENWFSFVILITYPILDLVLAVSRRILLRKNIFSADRFHIHHIIKKDDTTHIRSVLIIYLLNIFFASISILTFFVPLKGFYIVYFISLFLLFVYFLKEMLKSVREKRKENGF